MCRENKITGSQQLYVKNLDVKMKYNDLKIDLENILGGGFIGDMANEVLTLIGEDFIYNHKDTLVTTTKEKFKEVFSRILDMELLSSS